MSVVKAIWGEYTRRYETGGGNYAPPPVIDLHTAVVSLMDRRITGILVQILAEHGGPDRATSELYLFDAVERASLLLAASAAPLIIP